MKTSVVVFMLSKLVGPGDTTVKHTGPADRETLSSSIEEIPRFWAVVSICLVADKSTGTVYWAMAEDEEMVGETPKLSPSIGSGTSPT